MSTAKHEVITAAEVAVAESERKSLVTKFASRYGVEATRLMATLRATAFRQRPTDPEVTNEQMAALLIVADQHGLNPWTKEIHAFRDKGGGIVPVVGIDGWARIINEHPQFNGMEFAQSETVTKADEHAKDCPEWIECVMHRKDREHPTKLREHLDEVYKPAFVKDGRATLGPWQTHTKRMLRHKAMIQCARLAFSFAGIYDADEAERIIEAEEIDVTPHTEGKLSPKKHRAVVEGLLDATKAGNGAELQKLWKALTSDEQQFVWRGLHSWDRSAIKDLLDASKNLAPEDIDPWAIECLKTSTAQTIAETWRLIQDAYSERDREVPPDMETIYADRKQELGLQ